MFEPLGTGLVEPEYRSVAERALFSPRFVVGCTKVDTDSAPCELMLLNNDPPTRLPTLDQLFDALSHSSRRNVLLKLSEHESTKRLGVDELSPDRGTRIGLYHIHLPKLSDIGIIEWKQGSDTFKRGTNFGNIEPMLGLLRDSHEGPGIRAVEGT